MGDIVAYTPLHYGAEYLWYAIKAVEEIVDRHYILYTQKPSYGHRTEMPLPEGESKEILQCLAGQFDHVEWIEGKWTNETTHRGAINGVLRDSDDYLLPIDADEVWYPSSLLVALEAAEKRNNRVTGFLHFWRSFSWVCRDAMAPVRVINLRAQGDGYLDGKVCHFGYAQNPGVMAYKWAIHGHWAELRPDWWPKFSSWRPGVDDVHPTCEGIWNPSAFDPLTLPEVMLGHPYFGLELIA